MKLRVKDLTDALSKLRYEGHYSSYQGYDEGIVEIISNEENIENGILCGSVTIKVAYDTKSGDSSPSKRTIKSIEIYPNNENMPPTFSITETYSIGKEK